MTGLGVFQRLRGAPVTEQGIGRLARALPNCEIVR
jgi:hypothetical protein